MPLNPDPADVLLTLAALFFSLLPFPLHFLIASASTVWIASAGGRPPAR